MILTSTRCVLIACNYLCKGYKEKRYISAPEICAYYNMNIRTIMPALHRLVQQNILMSRRGGIEPGFIFARNPKEISIWDIIYTVEGEMHMPCCKKTMDIQCNCEDSHDCKIKKIYNTNFAKIKIELQNTSIINI